MEICKLPLISNILLEWFNCYDLPGSTIMNPSLPDEKSDVESAVAPEGFKNSNDLMKALAKNELQNMEYIISYHIISYHIISFKCTMCQGTLGHHCPMQH